MGKRAGCFACLPGDCCVALPHNATGLSAVNYCGILTINIFDAHVVWSWTGSAEHRISINIAITCTMQHVNCIHIHVIDR